MSGWWLSHGLGLHKTLRRMCGESGVCSIDEWSRFYARRLGILSDLYSDVILGQDFQQQHLSVKFKFGGPRPELTLNVDGTYCTLTAAAIREPFIFPNLSPNCIPIATKLRRFNQNDPEFSDDEINKLLSEGIIDTS